MFRMKHKESVLNELERNWAWMYKKRGCMWKDVFQKKDVCERIYV